MSPVSWVKKKLGRRISHRSNKSVPLPLLPRTNYNLLQPSLDILSVPLVDRDQEVDNAAASDLRCAYWQKTADVLSDNVDHELESIVLHLREKKVTVTRKSSFIKRKGSSRRSSTVPAFCRNLSRKASRPVTWLSSLTCLGIYTGPTLSQAEYAY